MASITKLFTSTLIVKLAEERALELDSTLSQCLPSDLIAGLNVVDGIDRSDQITVRQLLAHTPGIADYFEQRRNDGSTTFGRALDADFAWSMDEAVRIAKDEMRPAFPPGIGQKAHYSDTNYQLLGEIVEQLTGETYAAAVRRRIAEPLDLSATYVFSSATATSYDSVSPMLFGTQRVTIPLVMSSVRADGGVVCTAEELMRFLRAFFGAELFSESALADMQAKWRKIFRPLQYGTGIMRFALPRYYSPLQPIPQMVGHSGASGAVAFYVPDLDLFVTGTINQIKKRSLSYRVLTRLVTLIGREAA